MEDLIYQRDQLITALEFIGDNSLLRQEAEFIKDCIHAYSMVISAMNDLLEKWNEKDYNEQCKMYEDWDEKLTNQIHFCNDKDYEVQSFYLNKKRNIIRHISKTIRNWKS